MTGKGRRSARFAVWFTVFGAVASAVGSSAMAQSPIAAYGYSRATIPGIPGEHAKSVFPVGYHLYVEVKRGSRASAEWAWVRGKYYDCTLRKVSTPVLVESDPVVPTDKKEMLVSKTSNDVYSVVLGNVRERSASSARESELIANNQAVIALVVDKSSTYAAIQSIKALRPGAAM